MNDEIISIALPKGRLAEESIERFIKDGICEEGVVDFTSRKLLFDDIKHNLRFLLVRNMDIPSYVEHGAADFGIVGRDILAELNSDLYELDDLGFGLCRLSVAGVNGRDNIYHQDMKVATKYPNLTKSFFAKKGIMVECIKLYGSIEIAPIVNLSEFIVDLVSTGETMKKNGLIELETVMTSTARLVSNKYTFRAKYRHTKVLLKKLGLL